jgi:uncharacterized membrane protein
METYLNIIICILLTSITIGVVSLVGFLVYHVWNAIVEHIQEKNDETQNIN